jgi:hypothetical protein
MSAVPTALAIRAPKGLVVYMRTPAFLYITVIMNKN